MSSNRGQRYVSTGVPALDAILGGGFAIARLTQVRSTQWAEVAHVVSALQAAVPGPVVSLRFDRGDVSAAIAEIRAATCNNRVVYVLAPVVDLNTDHGLTHRLMDRLARELCAHVDRDRRAAVVFLSALDWTPTSYTGVEVEGNALRFYTTVRLDLRPCGGGCVVARTLKNKLVDPFRSVRLHIVDGALTEQPDEAWQAVHADTADFYASTVG